MQQKELNFLSELNNINRFNENNKDVKYMASLKAYKEYSTDKVLVMDYIEGIKIDNIKKLEEEDTTLKILRKSSHIIILNRYLKMDIFMPILIREIF